LQKKIKKYKKLENELKYLEEQNNNNTYKEDTSLKQKLEITIWLFLMFSIFFV
jgi:hypothetical protein